MDINYTKESLAELEVQYERMRAAADIGYSEELYAEIKQIYLAEEELVLGKGKAMHAFLSKCEIFINPADPFQDMIYNENTPTQLRRDTFALFHKKARAARELQNSGAIEAFPDFGHTMPDWQRLLSLGIPGIIKEAREHLRGASGEARAFYDSVIYTYTGMAILAKRLAAAAEAAERGEVSEGSVVLATKAKYEGRLHLASESLSAIAERAPETLAEAMQLYFLYYTVQHVAEGAVLRSLGSIDVLLWPYLKADLECGRLDWNGCRGLIRAFLLKWNSMHVLANIPFDLGLEVTPLTSVIAEEYVALDILDPKIHLIVRPDTPRGLIDTVLASIRAGKSSFVFINDRIARAALQGVGISERDAASYTLIGCYEPSAIGTELPCTVGGKINLARAIQGALEALDSEGALATAGYDELVKRVERELERYIEVTASEINTVESKYPKFMHAPALSATYVPCMERGVDIYAGGARYNNSSMCAVGLATYVDSLLAIRKLVFCDKVITLPELFAAMKRDFKTDAALVKKIRTECPKFGTGNPEADALARHTADFLAKRINGLANGRGGCYKLGMFSIDWIFRFGHLLAASADGRACGAPVSKNLSASVGMDTAGVTGSVRSALALDHTKFPNGAALDLCLHPSAVQGDEGLGAMRALVEVYFAGGGFAVQFNVLSADVLREAQKNPEAYKNLQVRLCGWNVYFTELDREAQDNLIQGIEGNG